MKKLASFNKASLNFWHGNYWNKPRYLPKPIFGRTGLLGLLPCVTFDIHPAKELN